MKSQDILLLLKLISLYKQEQRELRLTLGDGVRIQEEQQLSKGEWRGWETGEKVTSPIYTPQDRYSVRNLETVTGISKSEISASLKRSISVGLAVLDRKTHYPRTNSRALKGFIEFGIKYVFPAKPGAIVRGIPTAFAAPVMTGKLMTAGEIINVWPDPYGKEKGQAIEPLFKSVPKAVKQDATLYKLLALVDAVRLGSPRESQLAMQLLEDEMV